jgi:hypothetical protein
MDTEFDLTELLLVTDMNELEEGEKCYIKFYNNTEFHYNGLYNIVKLYKIIETSNFNYVNFMVNVKNAHTEFDLVYTIHNVYNNKFGIVINGCFNYCWLFKMPTNEYILK